MILNEDSPIWVQSHLMDETESAECALHELTQEFKMLRLPVEEVIVEICQDRELRRERDRNFDLLYQHTIAKALDNHPKAIQRDYEQICQCEEKRIRDDAAREEAKRKEKALQEEKLWQERIKAEEEAKIKAERAKAAALEADKLASKEASSKRANVTSRDTTHTAVEDSKGSLRPSDSASYVKKADRSSAINVVRASKSALELEKRLKQIYDELVRKNDAIKASANQNYRKHEQNIGRQVKAISDAMENVRTKAETLVELINSPGCLQSISIQILVEKIVSKCPTLPGLKGEVGTACVIVLVTSKIPLVIDILISELNRVCIYTVPKHYSEEAFECEDAYFQAIGKGESESIDGYIERLGCYMRLYGALVQTQTVVGHFDNLDLLKEGWGWLARFLNALPANLFTAVALQSFLQMAGFAMYCRYRNQFEKLMDIVARDFLNALKDGGSESLKKKLNSIKRELKNYIESKSYKKQPPQELQLIHHLESIISNLDTEVIMPNANLR